MSYFVATEFEMGGATELCTGETTTSCMAIR